MTTTPTTCCKNCEATNPEYKGVCAKLSCPCHSQDHSTEENLSHAKNGANTSYADSVLEEFRNQWPEFEYREDVKDFLREKLEEAQNRGAHSFQETTSKVDYRSKTQETTHYGEWDLARMYRDQERARITDIISEHKEESRSDGSFKHDDCYDALLSAIQKEA